MTDQQTVERLLRSLDTAWARHCQERMEARAAARAYDAMLKRLDISTEPYQPEKDGDQ